MTASPHISRHTASRPLPNCLDTYLATRRRIDVDRNAAGWIGTWRCGQAADPRDRALEPARDPFADVRGIARPREHVPGHPDRCSDLAGARRAGRSLRP